MGKMSKLPRFVHHFYATVKGYFWLPCPICGKNFGGHEIDMHTTVLWSEPYRGSFTCRNPACTKEARRRNAVHTERLRGKHVAKIVQTKKLM